MVLLIMTPFLACAGGGEKPTEIKSSQLQKKKYEKHKDAKPEKKKARKQEKNASTDTEQSTEKKSRNRFLSLFACCCKN